MTKYQTISALAEYTARNVAQSEDRIELHEKLIQAARDLAGCKAV